MKKRFNKRVSTADAIRLHAEANKSDPFAAKRMAMNLRKHPFETGDVAKEAKRILDARDAATRKAYAEWMKSEDRVRVASVLGGEPFTRVKRAA